MCDEAGVQFRVLNRSKGPAVWGPRACCDRELYKAAMRAELDRTPGLSLHEGEADDLLLGGSGAVVGVGLADRTRIRAGAVVLTANGLQQLEPLQPEELEQIQQGASLETLQACLGRHAHIQGCAHPPPPARQAQRKRASRKPRSRELENLISNTPTANKRRRR